MGLSFMQDGRIWSPPAASDYTEQCKVGRACADELVTQIRADENPLLLGQVVGGMIAAGASGGAVAGLLGRLGERLLRGV